MMSFRKGVSRKIWAGSVAGLAASGMLVAAGCASEASSKMVVADAELRVSLTGLMPLGDAYVYEGWLLTSGKVTPAGRFVIDEQGNAVPNAFALTQEQVAASTYVLTIEPKENDPPEASDVHVLAGEIANGAATLTTAHALAIGTDFKDAAGTYILETPTSSATDDAQQGIWFLDPMKGMGTLQVPALPSSWVYEGWIVGDSGPVSIGTFRRGDEADSNGAGPAAGQDAAAPAVPGEDFVNPAMDLVGKQVVVSVEPVPDDSPAPYAIKPLMHGIPALSAGMSAALENAAASLPQGSVQIVTIGSDEK